MTILLHCDNDFNLRVVPDLRADGYDVRTSPEAGKEPASDEQQLGYATSEERVIVTFNRKHFRRLHHQWQVAGKSHAGILTCRRYRQDLLLQYLRNFLQRETATSMQNRLVSLADYK